MFNTEKVTGFLCQGTWDRKRPDTDEVVSVSGKEGLSIRWPAEWSADWWWTLLVSHNLGLKLLDNDLLLQIPDLDDGASGGTEPVAVWWEGKSIDLVTRVQSVEGLGLLWAQVPKLGGT